MHRPARPDPGIRGESASRGESGPAQRTALARELEALGHGGCAFDLEAADACCVVGVAYQIVEHLVEGCGNPREEDQDLADRIRTWADAQDWETEKI